VKQTLALFLAAGFILSSVGAQALNDQSAENPSKPDAARVEPGSIEAIPAELRKEALLVFVRAMVIHPAMKEPWWSSDHKFTIPGTPVSIRMVGNDVAVLVSATPYKDKDGTLVLITQGQVWFRDVDGIIKYRSTVETISVNFGETLFFYPFGVQANGDAPLRIDLIVDRYDTKGMPALKNFGYGGSD
jgi:hypothetical protein